MAERTRHRAERRGPLTGVKVVDLTMTIMGPYCTQILADLGADVIKIESFDGDTTRYLPPGHEPDLGGTFANLNRGKRSIVIDLKSEQGGAIGRRLIAQADVFVHSIRGQAIARLGLGYATLRETHPRLVYANLYGFGRRGPYADLPAYDDVIQGMSGLAMLQATLQDGPPSYLATVLADKVAGLTGAYAIMAALFERERSGNGAGQEIEVPMFETMASFVLAEHLCGAAFSPPIGDPVSARVVSPYRRPYRTLDGFVSILIYNDKQWRRFFELIGNPEWSRDPRFASMSSRVSNVGALYGRLSEVIAGRTTEAWLAILRGADIPAAPVMTTRDLMADPHLDAVGFWEVVPDDEHEQLLPGIPTVFSRTPGRISHAAPALGEDSEEILAELGFDSDEISALTAKGIVGNGPFPRLRGHPGPES